MIPTTDARVIGYSELISACLKDGAKDYDIIRGTIEEVTINGENPDYRDYHIVIGKLRDVIVVSNLLEEYVRDILGVQEPESLEATTVKAFYLDGELRGFTKPDN